MPSHNHNHGHGGAPCSSESHPSDHSHSHDHDHDHDGPDRGTETTLFKHIDLDNVRCLNESEPNMARGVFKSHDRRLDEEPYLESDSDSQLILHIPFTGSVKLKSIALLGPPSPSCPAHMKAFVNKEDVDFDSVDGLTAEGEWDIVGEGEMQGRRGEVPEYTTKIAKFSNVRTLTLYFPSNQSGDDETSTRILYIGLKGEWSEIKKDPVITLYEAAPNPSDHVKLLGREGTAGASF